MKSILRFFIVLLSCGLVGLSVAAGNQTRLGPAGLTQNAQNLKAAVPSAAETGLAFGTDFIVSHAIPVTDDCLLVLGMQNNLTAVLCNVTGGEQITVLELDPVNETELAWYGCGATKTGWYFTTCQRLIMTDEQFIVTNE